ncbi:peptide chain release factor N(5)-glutamine methyltransferase [Altererythrobacter aerius]|uniref:Release factor glutamine methyltransferase n=1 Tax=Tsuneonella aeria TaxID=1837929 RepID=A0A6I4TET0_9SPHN|nr:peptide chain release factor N(5)-glutamine methyltransferase [Tsuneonella aeria]
MTVGEAIRAAAARLAGVSDTARLDAELLLAHAVGTTRSGMLLSCLRDPAPAGWDRLVEQRTRHVPVAYIVGRQEFWGLDLAVAPGVLIPRADSETIVRAALAARPDARRVLDLGTGSGALLAALLSELPGATGIGVEASPAAADVAANNLAQLGLPGEVVLRDWNRPGWRADLGRFDLVVSNPPYVEDDAALAPEVRDHEPSAALFAGADGLDAYRVLIPQTAALLEPDGVAAFEIGHTQAAAVTNLAEEAGFAAALHHDLAGRPRCLVLARAVVR